MFNQEAQKHLNEASAIANTEKGQINIGVRDKALLHLITAAIYCLMSITGSIYNHWNYTERKE